MSSDRTISVDRRLAPVETFVEWLQETSIQICQGGSLEHVARLCMPAYYVEFTYEESGLMPWSESNQEAIGLIPAREDIASAPLFQYAESAVDPETVDPESYRDDDIVTVLFDRTAESTGRENWIRDRIAEGSGVSETVARDRIGELTTVNPIYVPVYYAEYSIQHSGNNMQYCWFGARPIPGTNLGRTLQEARWVSDYLANMNRKVVELGEVIDGTVSRSNSTGQSDDGTDDGGKDEPPDKSNGGGPPESPSNAPDGITVPDSLRALNPMEVAEPDPGRTFDDIGGMSDLTDMLRSNVLQPIGAPQRFEDYDLSVTNGVLLYGPPGCGKTHIAGALAGELGRPFLSVSPSDLMSKWMGRPAIRVSDLFALARANEPCVVFIDEIDGVTQARGDGGSNQSEVQMVNQLLTELEEIGAHDVVVVGATNRPHEVDEAIRRSGRFDQRIEVPPPDAEARQAIFEVHLADPPTDPDLSLDPIVTATAGYAASDLEHVVEEASRLAMADDRPIETADLERVVEATDTSIEDWIGRYDFLAEETHGTGAVVQPDDADNLRARQIVDTDIGRTFEDVGGMTDLLETLRQKVLDPLANPETYEDYGLDPTTGVLLYGPPGCGKTYVSRALAGELGQYFVGVSPAMLKSKFSGESAQLVADVFAIARANQPCILFFDEIDAVAGQRSGPGASGSTETVNQLLTELEAVDDEDVVVVGATNLVEDVDGAIRRSGRFDERIEVPPPDADARSAILRVHLQDRPLAETIDWPRLADATAGFAASDLELVADEAARRALRADDSVTTARLLAAIEDTESSLESWPGADRYQNSSESTSLSYIN